MTSRLQRQKAPSNIGMMEGAFFVGRGELLQWVNRLLQINIGKIEQCCTGAIYCQIIDACHPNQAVTMRRVNWMAKADHEYIPNFKLLQASFDKLNIERFIDVDKLIRGKYQDNLEFMQWMKCYFDKTFAGHDYDPHECRADKSLPLWAQGGPDEENSGGGAVGSSSRQPPRAQPKPRVGAGAGNNTQGQKMAAAGRSGNLGNAAAGTGTMNQKREIARLTNDVQELQVTVDGLETERDYYFNKLREIEILTQTLENEPGEAQKFDVTGLMKEVQQILYKENAEEEGGAGGFDQ